MKTFLVTGLPRSGTSWTANFFTHGRVFCFHEAMIGCSSARHLVAKLQAKDIPYVGDSDSGLEAILDDVLGLLPEVTLVVIDRRPLDVADSLIRLGVFPGDVHFDTMVKRHQHALKRAHSVVPFNALFQSATLKVLWGSLFGTEPYDEDREAMLTQIIVQPHFGRYMEAYRDNPETIRLVAGER